MRTLLDPSAHGKDDDALRLMLEELRRKHDAALGRLSKVELAQDALADDGGE